MSEHSEDLRRYAEQNPGDDITARAIHDAFVTSARRFAEAQLSEKLRHRISVSEVVNSAMRSALSDVQNQRIDPINSQSFRRQLFLILQRKVISRVRHSKAEKRSVDKETNLDSSLLDEEQQLTPDTKAAVDELASLAAVEVLRAADDSTPIRVYVAALGVLFGCPPPAIQEALRQNFPNEKVPALRSIQLQVQKGQRMLEEKLSGEGPDD